MRFIVPTTVLAGVLLSSPAHAVLGDIADIVNAFKGAGFAEPLVLLKETETTFQLVVQGKLVDHSLGIDDASFSDEFRTKYWHGGMTFAQTDGQVNPDSLTAQFTIYHSVAVNRPHPGDAEDGDFYTFPSTSLEEGDAAVPFGKDKVGHPDEHFDFYDGEFSVSGTDNSITGWTFQINGVHAIPEPSTYMLLASGLLAVGAFTRRTRAGASSRSGVKSSSEPGEDIARLPSL